MIAVRSPSPSSTLASRKYDAMLNRSGNSGRIGPSFMLYDSSASNCSQIRIRIRTVDCLVSAASRAPQMRLIRHEQPPYEAAVDQVLVDDLVDVVGGDVP